MGAACHACIGGTNLRNEISKLQAEAPHIVVGTPGRVFDMLTRGHLCKYHVQRKLFLLRLIVQVKAWLQTPHFSAGSKWIKMFVLDEADEMLSRGFKDQIYEIFQKLSTNIQVRVSWTQTRHWLPSAVTEVCYNCVIQIFVSCNNASRVFGGRRLLHTALKMRRCRTSFLMFIGLSLKVQCHSWINLSNALHQVLTCLIS